MQTAVETVAQHRNQFTRDLQAPPDLPILFWPFRALLLELEQYKSTIFWFSGMKKATKKAYKTHLRLFCKFCSKFRDYPSSSMTDIPTYPHSCRAADQIRTPSLIRQPIKGPHAFLCYECQVGQACNLGT